MPNKALLVALAIFVLFLIVKFALPGSRRSRSEQGPALLRLRAARALGRDTTAPATERARALREGSQIALEALHRPGLAARLVLAAERLDPSDVASLPTVITALRRARRDRALEALLWQHVGAPASGELALTELIALYDGPLALPDRAAALRRLGASSKTGPS